MSETDIAKNMGLTTTQLRTQMSLAKDERRALQVATAKGLREKGYSLNEIADKMGFANDSSVRSLLNETSENRMNQAKATADVLRKLIEEKGMIDVGTGVERELGVSKKTKPGSLYAGIGRLSDLWRRRSTGYQSWKADQYQGHLSTGNRAQRYL